MGHFQVESQVGLSREGGAEWAGREGIQREQPCGGKEEEATFAKEHAFVELLGPGQEESGLKWEKERQRGGVHPNQERLQGEGKMVPETSTVHRVHLLSPVLSIGSASGR